MATAADEDDYKVWSPSPGPDHVRPSTRGFDESMRRSVRGGGGSGEADEQPGAWLPSRVGVDAEMMKEQVKKNLLRPQYNVCDFYYAEGVFQSIARSGAFENLTMAVIAFNALWISIDTDHNDAQVLLQASPVFQIIEQSFCCYFSFELCVRFMSFRRKRDCLKDAWFLFDSCLVFMMVIETWVMTAVMLLAGASTGGGLGNASILRMARLLRLSRMARMVRLFRAMPELLILIKGMVAATRSVFFTLCLLFILLYVFGIALRQLTDGTQSGEDFFATVPQSMYTLLITGTFFDGLGALAVELGSDSSICAVLLWLFVLLAPLTVMNMLIGVLCEVVSAVAATEKESLIVSFTKEKMGTLFENLDESCDGMIDKEEFLKILQKPEAARLLEEVGVDVVGLIDQADAIFVENQLGDDGKQVERTLTFMGLMEVILELRGSNHASVKHIVELRKYVLNAIAQTNKTLARLEGALLNGDGNFKRKDTRSSTVNRSHSPRDTPEKRSRDGPRGGQPPARHYSRKPTGEGPKTPRSELEVQDFDAAEDLLNQELAFFSHPLGLAPGLQMPVVPAYWKGSPVQGAQPGRGSPTFSLANQATTTPALSAADVRGLVERLDNIVAEARAELHREVARSTTLGFLPPQPHQPRTSMPNSPWQGGTGGGQVPSPSPGQQVARVFNMSEWEELRAKLSGIAGNVAGIAELRRIHSQLEEEEQEHARLLKGSAANFGVSKVWKPDD